VPLTRVALPSKNNHGSRSSLSRRICCILVTSLSFVSDHSYRRIERCSLIFKQQFGKFLQRFMRWRNCFAPDGGPGGSESGPCAPSVAATKSSEAYPWDELNRVEGSSEPDSESLVTTRCILTCGAGMGLFLHLVSSDRPLFFVQASEIICTGLPPGPGPGPQMWVPSCILLYSFLYRVYSMEFMSSKMSLKLLVVSSLQWLPISAQVLFHQPTAGEIINGGVPFIVSSTDSFTAPYFSQMTYFSLLLLAGTYSSPVSSFKHTSEPC
jgi:hypothetical protein